MPDRSTLHMTKLDAFAEWASRRGWVREDPRGDYEVLRLRHPKYRVPLLLYQRGGCDHATVQSEGHGYHLVRSFIRETRKRKEP